MLAAILTTFCFSLSSIFGARTARSLGAVEALFWRSILSSLFLIPVAFIFVRPANDASLFYFILSGIVGNGLADIAMFQGLKRIGARLTMLIMQCLAAPFAILIEWLWLGTKLTPLQFLFVAVILTGVVIALKPGNAFNIDKKALIAGSAISVVAGFFQALGAVMSRVAYQVLADAGGDIHPMLASFERILGGVITVVPFYIITKILLRTPLRPNLISSREIFLGTIGIVLLNILSGQIIGVSLFQYALQTTPSGIVLPIVAITPIVVIPLARLIDKELITLHGVVGGIVAVCGVVALKVF